MSTIECAIAVTADHIAMLRSVDEAGGTMPLAKLVEVLTPGVMTAPKETFGRDALRGARAAGELRRWGLLEQIPFSTCRQITAAGRAVLADNAEGVVA